MIKLVLISYLLQSVLAINHNCSGEDYNVSGFVAFVPAHVPFLCEEDAQKWVDTFCSSTARYLLAPVDKIQECWGDLFEHPKLEFIVDDYQYFWWRDWSDEVTKARPYIQYLHVQFCTMTCWGRYKVCIDQTLKVGFNISVLRPDRKRATLIQSFDITFTTDGGKRRGIFERYILTTQSSLTGLILGFFALMQQFICVRIPEIIAGLVPSMVMNHKGLLEFLEKANVGVVMFLVVMLVVMYLALLYILIRISKMCLEKNGWCSKMGSGLRKRDDYAQVSFTTTEADELGVEHNDA